MQVASKYMPKETWSNALARGRPRTELSDELRKGRLAKRNAWLSQIDPAHLFYPLFDLLTGVSFFAKNRAGELMVMNRSNMGVYGIEDEAEVVGLTDFDLNPPDMAQAYVDDDERILRLGEPLLNRVELWFDERGVPDWFVVSKLPIRDRDGTVIGVMGFSQSYQGRTKLLQPSGGLAKVIQHINEHYAESLSVGALARVGGLSPRQLQRRFKQVFKVGPHDFLIKTRLLIACRAIRETDRSLSEIAFSCGFTDQSAFTHYFREHMGLTPRRFRLQSRSGA